MQYQLSNDFIEIILNDLGAELNSLKKKNESLEYLWQGNHQYWNRQSPILFPIVGKLLDNEYHYKNITYSMNQHGFARDMCFEVWEKKESEVCFKLQHTTQTLEVYPFEFELYITYTLIQNTLKITYNVINLSKEKMLFSIGAHPAFNWPLDKGTKNDYFFEFEATQHLEQLPLCSNGVSFEKKIIPLANNQLPLNETLFKEDALIIQNLEHKTIAYKNRLDDKCIRLCFDEFPYLGLWSKPTGAPFICIEPWHGIADFIEHNKQLENKKGIYSLAQKSSFQSSYTISI